LVAPHLERLQEEGKNPLHEYLLPCAILRLKQELNRLPRAPGSRLVIWILDPRLATEKYARFFQRGLGREARVFTQEEELFTRTAEALGLSTAVTAPGETLAEPAAATPAAESAEAHEAAPEVASTEKPGGVGETQAET